MFSYAINEFKKAIKSKYTYVYFLGILGLVIIANAAVVGFRMIYGSNEGTFAYNLIEYATWCFVLPYYSCIFIADMGFGKEYPNPFIKDHFTKDLSCTKIYFGKLICEILLSIIFMAFAFVVLILVTTVFQFKDGTISWYSITDFLSKMALAIPLWFAGICFGNMFLFMFENKKKAFIYFFVLTLLIPRVIMQLAAEPLQWAPCRFIRKFLISQNFSLIPYPANPERNTVLIVVVGIVYSVIACVVGCICYNRKKNQ